ncbi:MAG: hypothetical protein ACR2JV_01940 [Gaiellales bacterium]
MAWIEAEDVKTYLDLEDVDARLTEATLAVKAEVERLRSDLDFSGSTQIPASVIFGAILWAALFYQQRNAPSGFSGYGDGADIVGDVLGSKKADIYRFIGLRRPVTA